MPKNVNEESGPSVFAGFNGKPVSEQILCINFMFLAYSSQ